MSIKVLVADDSITIQKVIGIIFGGDEYSLTVVDNGKAAVDKAREIIPDILLIDALMPGMSGYEAAEAVRATPSLAAKPILILTGSFEPFDEEKAKKCGADDFISKPFESQQIISKVRELLELGSSRAEAAQQVTIPEPDFKAVAEPPVDVSSALQDIPVPVAAQQADVSQPAAPVDIWGAFTPDEEQPFESTAPSVATPPSAVEFEPDVFAIVSEENSAEIIQSPEAADISHQSIGTKWIPVEENTFEFEEEAVVPSPLPTSVEETVPVEDSSFGEIAFEDTAAVPADQASASVIEEFFTLPEPEPVAPAPAIAAIADISETVSAPNISCEPPLPSSSAFTAPAEPAPPVMAFDATSAPVSLTEEQLRVALSSVSREVIERIVWEIVPDLADALIREAIRKIKEGA